MSGISNINVDVERLLGAINIVTKTVYKNQKKFCAEYKDVTIYELDNSSHTQKGKYKLRLKGRLKGTIKILSDADVEIKAKSKFESLHAENVEGRIVANDLTESSTEFEVGTDIYRDGSKLIDNKNEISLDFNQRKPYQCVIKKAVLKEKDFCFRTCGVFELEFDGQCDIIIQGKCSTKEKGVLVADGVVKIEGEVGELIILGDCLKGCMSDENKYHEFSVGYKKQAMNVIANVLEARDYLYLWVYAHHKVTYYANYLLPALASVVFK